MNTRFKNVLASLDRLLSAILFNEPDFTISALCYIAQITSASNPNPRRVRALRAFGRLLDRLSPGHTIRAGEAAFSRAEAVLKRVQG